MILNFTRDVHASRMGKRQRGAHQVLGANVDCHVFGGVDCTERGHV